MCFYSDQKYVPCYKCLWQLYSLAVLAKGGDVEEEESGVKCLEEEEIEKILRSPHISLNALNGVLNYWTLRIKETVGKHVRHKNTSI